jgi:hypothetical protein
MSQSLRWASPIPVPTHSATDSSTARPRHRPAHHRLGHAGRLAKLGEDEEWLHELSDQLEPQDGCLWIYDTNDRATLAFTERGVEGLKELILDQKR